MLEPIEIPSDVDEVDVPVRIRQWISEGRQRIETFQDCWDRPLIEQFVPADYELVYQSLCWTKSHQPMIGNRFLEWGCGFAIISALASTLDFDCIGIEAEDELLQQGRQTIAAWEVDLELSHGNFLPQGAEDLADDPTLPSLGHPVGSVYDRLGLDLDDFALVYTYPWPGESDFHESVFDRYGAKGALLMLFRGPNEMRLWRKTS